MICHERATFQIYIWDHFKTLGAVFFYLVRRLIIIYELTIAKEVHDDDAAMLKKRIKNYQNLHNCTRK